MSSTSIMLIDIEVSTENGYPTSDCFDWKGSSPGGTISVAWTKLNSQQTMFYQIFKISYVSIFCCLNKVVFLT